MKFGVCCKIEQAEIVKAAGFDFIECAVVSLEPEKSDEEFRDTMERYLNSPVPVEAFNILLPGDLKIVGEQVDYDRVHRYLSKALERVKAIGADTIVFGSGRARNIPDGFSRERAEEQIVRFLNIIADYADPLDMTIVIEPLNTTESNIINSVPEAVRFAEWAGRKSVKALADFYHMHKENESLEHIVEHADWIRHIHISDNRRAPGLGNYPYDVFVDCVRRANYNGRLSIECLWEDFAAETASAKKYLDGLFPER